MAGEIQLLLTVDDKGSATVRSATNNMTQSIERATNAARHADFAFGSWTSKITGMVGRMFSFNAIVGTLAGGAGLGLLGKRLVDLGMQADNAEVFKEKVEGLSGAWTGFTGRLGNVIAQSPVIQDVLAGMTTKVADWEKALIENKAVINDWLETAKSAAAGVGSAIAAATSSVRSAAKTLQQSMTTGGTGLIPGGYIGEGGADPAAGVGVRPGSDAYWEQQYPARGSAAQWEQQYPARGNSYSLNFNGQMTRSDVVDIVSEMERREFRDYEIDTENMLN